MRSRIIVLCGCIAASVALRALAAGPDPILGNYQGAWAYSERDTIDGQKGPTTFDSHSTESMVFAPDHTARITLFEGKWKKTGNRYSIDCSHSAREFTRTNTSDATAQAKLVHRGIRLENSNAITGRIREKLKYRESGKRVTQLLKGPYLGIRFVAP